MGEPTEAVYEAAYEAFKRAPLGSSITRACVDAVWPLAVAEGRREAAAEIERPGSMLCDCPRDENAPIHPETGAAMDHHCDCAAVQAAATMRPRPCSGRTAPPGTASSAYTAPGWITSTTGPSEHERPDDA